MSDDALTTITDPASSIEAVIAKGDLGKLTPTERVQYYVETCKSLGLNPLTRPFDYITLNQRMVLYPARGATDQLRRIYKVDIDSITTEILEDILVVTTKGHTPDGRTDTEVGAVSIAGLRGDAKANAIMKAHTKAKRRLTLSMIGLGWLDETEVETIPNARKVTVTETGEIMGEVVESAALPAPRATDTTNASPLATDQAYNNLLTQLIGGVDGCPGLPPAFAEHYMQQWLANPVQYGTKTQVSDAAKSLSKTVRQSLVFGVNEMLTQMGLSRDEAKSLLGIGSFTDLLTADGTIPTPEAIRSMLNKAIGEADQESDDAD